LSLISFRALTPNEGLSHGPFFKPFILSISELVFYNLSHPVQDNHDMAQPSILPEDVTRVVGMGGHGLGRMHPRSKSLEAELQAIAFVTHDSLNVPLAVHKPPLSSERNIHPSKFTLRLFVNQIVDSGDQSSYPFHGAAALGICAEMWTRAPP